MACNIEAMKNQVNGIIDRTVKGNADSVVPVKTGFAINYGKQYRVKDRESAFRMAERKVAEVDLLLMEAGFNPRVFGPFLEINQSEPDRIRIDKTGFPKLVRAYEIRNEADAREMMVEEVLEEQRELTEQEISDAALREQEEKEILLYSPKYGVSKLEWDLLSPEEKEILIWQSKNCE